MKQKILILLVFIVSTSGLFSQSPVVQQILDSARQDSLTYFVRELSGNVSTIIDGTSQTIISRHKLQPGNALAETYIKQKLQSYGLSTTIQSFSATGKNVYAVQPGTEFPNRKYIICAHYDDMPAGTTAPGADDNASGTAAVIEAARIFSQHSFPFTIVYALWDEEEQGLVGSAYYAAQAANAGDSILGVINLDMIAYDNNNDGVINIHSRPAAGNSVEIKDKMVECNSLYGINMTLVIKSPGSTYSDHASFWSNNYGAVLLIEDENDFHPYYHTVNDLLQYFNQPYYFKSAKLAFAALAEFALNLNLNIEHIPVLSIELPEPINSTAFISTGMEIGSGNLAPRLYYRTKAAGGTFGLFNSVTGYPVESGNYNFIIPAQQIGTIVQYYIAAQDANSSIVKTLPAGGAGFNPPGNIPPETFFQFFVASQTVVMYDEANTINNWTSGGGWNITNSKFVSPPSSFTDSPGGNYANNTTAIFKYNNQVNLTGILGAALEYDAQWAIEDNWDYAQVQVSTNNGAAWTSLTGLYTNPGTGSFQPNGQPLYDGIQLTWVHETIDLSDYADQNISLRFLLRTDGSITADGIYLDNIKITLFTAAFSFSVYINDGWNIVSIPGLHPLNQDVTTWWPGQDPDANVFRFAGGYTPVTEATPGEGYWMKHSGQFNYVIEEINPVPNDPVNGAPEWNLIGGYHYDAAVSGITTTPPGSVTGSVFGYSSSGGYTAVTELVPGKGYWVNLSQAAQIHLPDPSFKGSAKLADIINEEWGRIILTDKAGRHYTLYAVNGEASVNPDQFELPPAPHAGMFDVRYGSQRYADNLNTGFHTIELSGMEYPVTVKVENTSIRLQDETGKVINTMLKPGEEISISRSEINKLRVTGDVIPDQYSLSQNYPNPFNPATIIGFGIPEDAKNITLIIYDAIGQKIAELLNGTLEAGYYTYHFNAREFASGLYIYQLRTDKFVSTKKMMLLK